MSRSSIERDVASAPAELRTLTLSALLLCAAQAPLNSTMIAVALPAVSLGIATELTLVTSVLVTSYLIVSIVAQSPGGKLTDRVGHARAAKLGMLLQALGAPIALASSTLHGLVLSRCFMALGGALVVPATMALVRTHVPTARRGRLFGVFGATMSLSAALGPPLGGELVTHFGYRSVFVASLPVVALAALLLRIAPPPQVAGPGSRASELTNKRAFDWLGTLLLGLALCSLVLVSKGQGPSLGVGAAAFMIFGAGFLLYELRQPDPVLDPRLFSLRPFASGSSLIMLHNFALYGLLVELPSFFEHVRGASSRATGRMLIGLMAPMFVMAVAGGRLTDRLGARTTALLGALPLLLGMFLMRDVASFMTPADALPALFALGAGFGLSGAPGQTSALTAVSGERAGMSAGATATMRYLGGVLAVIVLSALTANRVGTDLVHAHELTVRLFALAVVVATAVAFALPGRRLLTSAAQPSS
jgi:MFS family permease